MRFDEIVVRVGQVLDGVGVAAIVVGAVVAIAVAMSRLRRHESDTYTVFRQWLGRSILLGLEILVAADIIRTVAAQPTLTSVTVLAVIVLIRTLLSFSLELEITGRWPWQKRTATDQPRSRPTPAS